MEITSDLAKLEDIVSKASATDILETLRQNANLLYKNLGTPIDWANVKDYPNTQAIWETQHELKLISEILFTKQHEPKVREMYQLITKKRAEGYEYSLFYAQLATMMDFVSCLKYGINRQKGNGVLDFSDYEYNIVLLQRLLTIGPRDIRPFNRHDAFGDKERASIALLPGADDDNAGYS